MKIFFFTSVLAGGGAERVLCQLANCFSESNEVFLIAAYKEDEEYCINDAVKKIYIDKSIEEKNSLKQIVRLRNLIRIEKPDICVSFLPQPNFKMLLATMGLKTKVIVSIRNDPNREYASKSSKVLAKFLYPLANGIVFQTKEAKDWFSQSIQRKSSIIMNQVDQKFFEVKRSSSEYWVATGRLNRQKNYSLMIEAFKRFVYEYPSEVLRIYGKGTLEDELKDLIEKNHLENNILLMGQTNDVVEVLSHAKGFLLSSDYEGMPNGLLEAQAMGLPCISTDFPCGGAREIISDDNGILVPVNDIEAFSAALISMQSNPERRNELGDKAKLMAERFKPRHVFDEWQCFLMNYVRGQ